MQNLIVIAENSRHGPIALCANTFDLGYNGGWFAGKKYPLANDYFDYLRSQGWRFESSIQVKNNLTVYSFEDGRGYKIVWDKKQKTWQGGEENHHPRYDPLSFYPDYFEDLSD